MLSTTVIIVLREVLEAALLISLFANLSVMQRMTRLWVVPGILSGIVGAWLYSVNIDAVANWQDGVGQELVNGSLQVSIFLLVVLVIFNTPCRNGSARVLSMIAMASGVAAAMTLEGFELLTYVLGFSGGNTPSGPLLAGIAIGAGIGISAGVLLFYSLQWQTVRQRPLIGLGLLSLFAAGLLVQAVALFQQADWLGAHEPLWNTGAWLAERSTAGQLLYVMIGYEATPSPEQALAQFTGLAVLLWLATGAQRRLSTGKESQR